MSAFATAAARQRLSHPPGAPFRRRHPLPHLPGRVVPHVLAVAALELGDPVSLLVLMEAGDPALHGQEFPAFHVWIRPMSVTPKTTFDAIPRPNHTAKIGARITRGIAFIPLM